MNRIDCPLCDWHIDAEPPDVGYNALGDVFGLGVMQQIAWNEHLAKTERTLREHLETHSLVEWVRKVAELKAEVDRLTVDAVLNVGKERHR